MARVLMRSERKDTTNQGGKVIAAVLTGWNIFRPHKKAGTTWVDVLSVRKEMNKTIIAATEDDTQDWQWAVKYAIEIHREAMLRAAR
jgi:hypothetical protein